jgi:phospholipid transport system substrate-binding protein
MLQKVFIFAVTCTIAFTLSNSWAKEPLQAVQEPVEQVLQILRDPIYQAPHKKEAQRHYIFSVIRGVFDFESITRATLRPDQWQQFNPGQLEEFTALYTLLLSNTYLNQIQKDYLNETVEYLDQEILDNSRAYVKTIVVRNGMEIPIDYRLHLKNGSWKIYNVYIERRSFVANFRDEFSHILMKNSPDFLIDKIRERVDHQNQDEF